MSIEQEWISRDRKLPFLPRAVNDEEMRLLISAGWRATTGPQAQLRRVRHEVLKYTPGKRCVFAYRLEWSGRQAQPRRIIGKMHRKDRGAIIFENLQRLWQAGNQRLEAEGGAFLPQPLAYLPAIGMILQAEAPGRALSEFSAAENLEMAVRAVARSLAKLHGLAVAAGERRTLSHHVTKYCPAGARDLMQAGPELGRLAEEILSALANAEASLRAPLCPVHGDLGLTQIFIANEQAVFIDFDGFCQSHAALDIANFLIALDIHFPGQAEERAEVFFATYQRCRPAERPAGLACYQALIYLRRAMICFRHQNGPAWREEARRLLERAKACLEPGH